MDTGERLTEREYRRILKEIKKIYSQAGEEVAEKMKAFIAHHVAKDEQMKSQLAAGKITEAEYKRWLKGQVFIGKQWEAKAKDIADTMVKANKQAANIVNVGRMAVFAENMNYEIYNLEHSLGLHSNFSLYSRNTVAELIKDHPKLLPEWKIDEKKDYVWNYKRVKNAITQGVIQGEGVQDIAKRLVSGLKTTNDDKMRLFARTAVNGAQNAGRQHMAEEAEEEGISVMKMWIATLDDRTRDTHQRLDGQTVPVGQAFVVNDDGVDKEIMFPGDPSCGYPELVYNCRCAMKEVYDIPKGQRLRRAYREVEDEKGKTRRESYLTEAQTYEEWKKAKSLGYDEWKKVR